MGILGRVAGLGRVQRELAEVQALLQLAQVEEAVGQVGSGGVANVDRPGFRGDGGERPAEAARREVVVPGHREGEADVVPDAGEADGVRLPLGQLERPQLVVDGAHDVHRVRGEQAADPGGTAFEHGVAGAAMAWASSAAPSGSASPERPPL